jgi:hypothetical protein
MHDQVANLLQLLFILAVLLHSNFFTLLIEFHNYVKHDAYCDRIEFALIESVI